MMINADCTLYKFDAATGGYNRHFIPEVYWEDCKRSNVNKTGIQADDSVLLILYSDSVVPENPQKDIIVRGTCYFEFDNSSPQTISAGMKELWALTDIHTVSSVDNMMYGGLPHMEISAK